MPGKVFNACIIVDNDKVLIKYAKRGVSEGKWDFPGGKVDPGESYEESVRREIFEETGLVLGNVTYKGKIGWHFDEENILNVGHIFFCDNFKGELKESTEEGSVKWVQIDELGKYNLWKDTLSWLPHAFKPEMFDAEVHYNNKSGEIVKSINIKTKSKDKVKV